MIKKKRLGLVLMFFFAIGGCTGGGLGDETKYDGSWDLAFEFRADCANQGATVFNYIANGPILITANEFTSSGAIATGVSSTGAICDEPASVSLTGSINSTGALSGTITSVSGPVNIAGIPQTYVGQCISSSTTCSATSSGFGFGKTNLILTKK